LTTPSPENPRSSRTGTVAKTAGKVTAAAAAFGYLRARSKILVTTLQNMVPDLQLGE
jgi:hypothetical protein